MLIEAPRSDDAQRTAVQFATNLMSVVSLMRFDRQTIMVDGRIWGSLI